MFRKIVSVFLALCIILTPFNALGLKLFDFPSLRQNLTIDIYDAYAFNTFNSNIEVMGISSFETPVLYSIELADAYADFVLQISTAYKDRKNLSSEVPEEYKVYIERLKELHPNWKFEFYNTGIDWNKAVNGQNVRGRNSVTASRPLTYRSTEIGYEMITERYTGYIPASSVINSGGRAVVMGLIPMFDVPSLAGNVVYQLPSNAEVAILGSVAEEISEDENEWLNVCYEYKYMGYVPVEGNSWYQASIGLIKYSLDPRNFLNEESVFMFEDLNYNYDLCYSLENVKAALVGTFMEDKYIKDKQGNDILFAEAILLAAEIYNINPNHIISRIVQEVGPKGSSASSGHCSAYPGIYNFYNIGANTGYLDGLRWASRTGSYGRPWNNEYNAIIGGAEFLSKEYINNGQNTLYFEKFAVTDNSGNTGHQYMANIEAPKEEGRYVYNFYNRAGLLNNNYVFIVPIFENLPENIQII